MTDPYVVDWVKTIDAIPGTEFYYSPGIDDDSDNTYVSYLSERLNDQNERIREVAVMQLRKTDGHIGWTKKISIGFDETKPLSNFAASITVDSTHIYVTYNDQENTDVHVMKLDKNNNGNLVWTQNYSINAMSGARSISVGPSGLYLTYCTNTNTVEIFKINQETGVIQWNKKTNNNNINSELAPSSYNYPSIAVYSDGIYLTFFGDGISSGSGNTNLDSTKYDIVVMKMTKAGQIVWTKQTPEFNTADNDSEPSIAVDSSGVYVTYSTEGTVAGNTNSGGQDIVVFKLDLDGNFEWAKQTPSFNTSGNDSRPSIALYGSGVYVTYKFSANIAIIHLAKSSGEIVWRRTSPNQDGGENVDPTIAVYSDGIYVTYSTNGRISGDGNTNSGSFDIVVMKLDTEGEVAWIQQRPTFNTSGFDGKPSIAVDSTGVYVTYETDGTVSGNTNSGQRDIAVFKWDLDGNFGWAKQTPSFNTSGYEALTSIAVDATGVYVTYRLIPIVGVDRIAVVKLSKVDGEFQWNTQTLPDVRLSVGSSFINMAINDTGVYVVSNYNKTISGSQRQQIKVIKIFKNSGQVDWVQESEDINNTSGNNSKPTIAADASGVYVTYQTDINVNGDSDIVVVKMTSAGVFEWREQTPSMNTEGNDSEPTIALDSNYIYVAYSNDLAGNSDIYVMKMRKDDRSVEWLEKPEAGLDITTDNDTKPKIAVNANGIYVTYETRTPDVATTYTRIAVIRVSDSGALVWRKEAENKPIQQYLFDRPSIAVDDTGVYVTGSANNSAPGEENTNSGKLDIVVFKLNLDGAFGWVTQTPSFNTSDDDMVPRIAIDATGIYVTYATEDTVPGSGNTNSGQKDIVVFKLNKDGTFVWTKQTSEFNTGLPDGEPSIAVDSSGVYVTYTTQGGTVAGEGNTNSGGIDIVVFKLDLDGTFGWAKQTPSFNTLEDEDRQSIAVDATGVYVTYNYNSGNVRVIELTKNTGEFVRQNLILARIIDVTPSIATDSTAVYVVYSTNDVSLGSENVNSGSQDIVVMKMDTNGNVLWRKQRPSFNTTQADAYARIAVDSTGVYLTYMTFEGGTIPGSGNTNSGDIDIVVFKLNLDGTFGWAKQTPSFNTTNEDGGSLIALDATGVYVTYSTVEEDFISANIVKLGKDTGSITWVKQQTPDINSGGRNYFVDIVADTTGVYFTNLRTNDFTSESNDSIVVTKMKEPEPICLLEGTLVRTTTGSVPIELVKKDDYVLNQEYKPVRVVLTSKTTFEYKTNPTSDYELDNVLYTIPAGTLGATSNVYLTRHHRFMTSDGTMKKPEEYGLKRSEASEVCKTNDLYTVYHLRLEDEYNNHFIVNGDCIVEDWWDWPRPDGL